MKIIAMQENKQQTKSNKNGIFFALLAAALYSLNAPFSKLLLKDQPPTLTAGLLYLGAGIGMCLLFLARPKNKNQEQRLTKKEAPYTILMILLDIAAPICLLLGLKDTPSATASLLNNFEIVATAVIALTLFQEKISPRLWLGIILITLSCAILSVENFSSLRLSRGSLFILLAGAIWGMENNCTRKISSKDPLQIVLLKGFLSGAGSILIGICVGERLTSLIDALLTLSLGFAAYGLSIYFYVYAQRRLGAAKTSAYYAVAPFMGVLLSFLIFQTPPRYPYYIALTVMIIGAFLSSSDKPLFKK